MAMIHYKFKNSKKQWDSLNLESNVINVLDLKRSIVQHKGLSKSMEDFDLMLTNAQTGEDYREDGYLIPKNTSLIVKRVPASRARSLVLRKPVSPKAPRGEEGELKKALQGLGDDFGPGVYGTPKAPAQATEQSEEEQKLLEVLDHASRTQGNYDTRGKRGRSDEKQTGRGPPRSSGGGGGGGFGSSGKGNNRGQSNNEYKFSASGKPNPGYICYRCNKPGHFIHDCPLDQDGRAAKRHRNPTGIPRSFLVPIEQPTPPAGEGGEPTEAKALTEEEEKEMNNKMAGGTVMVEGQLSVARPNEREFNRAFGKDEYSLEGQKGLRNPKPAAIRDIPRHLECTLCKGLLQNAVVIPCCWQSFCDECIRQALLADNSFKCPS